MATRSLVLMAVLLLAVPLSAGSASSTIEPAGAPPTANGNFSIVGPGPETTLPAASILSVTFELRDPNYTAALKGIYVRVPAPTAQFNVSYGDLRITLKGTTVIFNSTNWTNPANTTTNQQLLNQTVFPNTGRVSTDRAVFASGDLALTSPAPYGALTVELRWRWAASPSFGANFTGNWEPSASGIPITPDQFVPIESPTALAVSPGQGIQVCLGGPVAGRTFYLEAVMPSPRLDFADTNVSVPTTGTPPFCMSLTFPSWLEPQTINVYVWDYNRAPSTPSNVTSFLLYVLKVSVVPLPTPSPSLYGIPLTQWYEALGAVVAFLAILGIAMLLRNRTKPRSVTGTPNGTDGKAASAATKTADPAGPPPPSGPRR
ncbi:MAG: hypothetical protein L3K08_04510 [Thermoplasmata archaeon]|nr:hypothetical protein [Thermoplasmata archaeon]